MIRVPIEVWAMKADQPLMVLLKITAMRKG